MIGMILVTHGRLGAELLAALEHVCGPQPGAVAIGIGPDDDIEARRREIIDRIAEIDDGDGVVLLTDMFGGTPSNLAISVMDKARIEVVAGINLPLLIKFAGLRADGDLEAAVACAQEAGRKYINIASHLLREQAS